MKKYNKYNKYIILLVLVLILVIVWIILSVSNNEKNEKAFIDNLLESSGVAIKEPPKEYSDKFAEEVIGKFITDEEKSSLVTDGAVPGKPQAILFDYGASGKLLSLQSYLDMRGLSSVVVTLESKESIKLRHQINIGTDLATWELIKKETNRSDNPFKRIYVFAQGRGEGKRMKGLSYYEGSIVEIEYDGLINDETINNLVNITWNLAKKHPEIYDSYLKEISEGLFKDDPVLTRPDLPDPDKETP